jgi:N-acetyl-gamma-glutamyl-phosphate reductase
MTYKVFVDGQEGTTGLQINEYLAQRSDVEVLKIDTDKRKDLAERKRLINASDVTFLCLPDEAAKESVSLVDNPNTCVIDASTAHRVNPAGPSACRNWPGSARQDQGLQAHRQPGLPCHGLHPGPAPAGRSRAAAGRHADRRQLHHRLLRRRQVDDCRLPGCRQRRDPPQGPASLCAGLAHKHLPEMQAYTGLTVAPIFQPIVGPFYKGLAVTAYLQPQHSAARPRRPVQKIIADYYAGERFINVLPVDLAATTEGGFYNVEANNDTNRVDIAVFGNDERMLVVARLDNLGKGASGAAVQAMNVHLGVEETLGLI